MLKVRSAAQHHDFQANTYIISSEGECAVIDPSVPYESITCDGQVRYIMLTHAHFDHMLDIDSWVKSTEATVIVAENDMPKLSDSRGNCYAYFKGSDGGYYGEATAVKNGDMLPLGNTAIRVIECPGHTSGSVCYLCEGNAFVGDTVFAGGGYGRFDLPTGNFAMLKDSIDKITSLPDDTVIYPGHGNSTTVKQYKSDIGR